MAFAWVLAARAFAPSAQRSTSVSRGLDTRLYLRRVLEQISNHLITASTSPCPGISLRLRTNSPDLKCPLEIYMDT
jgi:hypothetical protein